MNCAALRLGPIPVELGIRAAARDLEGVVPASQMQPRPPATMIVTGIAEVDAFTGGFPRGALTEIFGAASSGRTSLVLSTLAQATARGEVCAFIDATDSFDPQSAQAAGVRLDRVLWVRCGTGALSFSFPVSRKYLPIGSVDHREATNHGDWGVENTLKAADFLLQAGGFGLVVMDLGDVPPATARRVPLTSWFRFRRAVEHTPTALVLVEQEAFAKSAAGLVLRMHSQAAGQRSQGRTLPSHARLLTATEISVEVVRAVTERKRSARAAVFQTRAQWAG